MLIKASTVAEFAADHGISIPQTLALIHRKQLDAINVASNPSGRPAWRIPAAAVAKFVEARTNRKPVKSSRRKRAAVTREWV